MIRSPLLLAAALLPTLAAGAAPAKPAPTKPLSSAEILQRSSAADWRQPALENTLYLELAAGRVVIELAPDYAPAHAQNIRTLAKEHYFDDLAIVRSQDNYVVQWGDPEEDEKLLKPLGSAQPALKAEFDRKIAKGLPFTPLKDADSYAPAVGHSLGFPAARDPALGKTWLAHCYGMVGAGRDQSPDSGSGTQLYVVIGHAPRHLDRNVTLVGRVLQGMDLLSTLPRGSGALGFYEKASQRVPIKSIRLASEIPEAQRTALEVLSTDTATWKSFVAARRTRREDWFVQPTGRIELCNVPIPVRAVPAPAAAQ